MPRCFPMFVHVFQATRGVKNDLDQNLSFFTDIYKVNGALNGPAGCNPQPSIFCRFQCIFLTNLEKNTGGTSLPEGFSPLVHFGPPYSIHHSLKRCMGIRITADLFCIFPCFARAKNQDSQSRSNKKHIKFELVICTGTKKGRFDVLCSFAVPIL